MKIAAFLTFRHSLYKKINMLKIGIIREDKTPSDSRVPLNPSQCKKLIAEGIDLVVQSSQVRCFTDENYREAGVPVVEDITDRDILIGVKEVPIEKLISDKTYFFFSHTIKEQVYNRKLLQAVIERNIRLLDYEVLTNENGARVIAFGKFAGMVGAHNALWTYAQRTRGFELPRMKDLYDYAAAKEIYNETTFPAVRLVLTGSGRVANGAALVLDDMGFQKVRPMDYITHQYDYPVYTQLSSFYYTKRKDKREFDDVKDFYNNPSLYESDFEHFLSTSDIMINGIYWDNNAPAFFTLDQLDSEDFKIKVIADVTCDIAPVSSIPTTIKASTIADPVFGYDPKTRLETEPYQENSLDMMTIDNLPNEMPRDASTAFGEMFIKHVIPELKAGGGPMLDKGSVTRDGDLGGHFEYLRNYLNGK